MEALSGASKPKFLSRTKNYLVNRKLIRAFIGKKRLNQ
jgi:hypothetical protein